MFRKLIVTLRLTRQACSANLPASENLPVRDMPRACEIRVRHNYDLVQATITHYNMIEREMKHIILIMVMKYFI